MYTLPGRAPHQNAPALGAVLGRRDVQVQAYPAGDVAGGLLGRRRQQLGGGGCVSAVGLVTVPPHVAPERLPDGELEPADGALVHPRLGRLLLLRRWWWRWQQRRPPEAEVCVIVWWLVVEQPVALVAGAVAPQRLERRELPAARLALEHATAVRAAR
jgi:hypothetical protein